MTSAGPPGRAAWARPPRVLHEAFEGLLSLGYNAVEAREKIDAVSAGKTKLKSVADVIMAIHQLGRE